jgi:O-acetyl-ADP-ribose deacetylase (regulator of RNase III)
MAQGPINVGEAVVTSAGSLRAKHVIHAAVMGQDLHTSADLIKKVTHSSLALAEQRALSSISFPALGTGVGGFSMHHCASLMLEAVIDFLPKAGRLREVRFVLFDTEAFRIFEQELKRRFTARGH